MPRLNARRLLLCTALTVLPALAVPASARAEAEDSAAVEKVTKLNKKAVDEYQNLNFEEARKLLKSAIELCGQSGLENHPVTARTYVHLGIVTFTGFKQRDEAVKQFRKALDIQADIKLDKVLATPEVQEVYDEAVAQQKDAATKKPPSEPVAGGIDHEAVTQSPQGSAITIKASVAGSVGAKKVVLSFSADGADDFAEKDMKEEPPGSGSYTAEIPQSATQGGVVDYFIEALGDDDKVLASKGSANASLKIAMLGANGQPVAPGIRKPGGKGPKPAASAEENPSWFFGLGVGSGVGWTTGNGEIFAADKVSPAGFEMAKLLHFAPEVGYYVSPDLLVSVQLRLQLITGATEYKGTGCGGDMTCSPGTYAFAGFARASYFFGEGDLRSYIAGNVGVGTIRHVATFNSHPNCGPLMNQTCIDTVPSGPIFVGPGAGIAYNVSPAFVLVAGTNALVGFTKFTFNVDLNLGVAFEY